MSYKSIYYCLLFFCTSLIACEKIDIGVSFNARIGEKYRVDSKLSFYIDSVYDYRCPSQVLCVWGGDANIYFTFNKHSSRIDTVMFLNTSSLNPTKIDKFYFKVLNLTPENQTGEKIPQNEYIITMIVEEN